MQNAGVIVAFIAATIILALSTVFGTASERAQVGEDLLIASEVCREYCRVREVNGETVLINTEEEIYHIGTEYTASFQEGDLVLLGYSSREQLEDGTFSADVLYLYPSDNVLMPNAGQ